jgi:hypothetical protein
MGQRKTSEDALRLMLQVEMVGVDRWQGGTPWREEARCRDLDSYLFFPDMVEDAVVPLRVCRLDGGCPVRAQCLEVAEEWGIWGGTTEWDRRQFGKLVRAA